MNKLKKKKKEQEDKKMMEQEASVSSQQPAAADVARIKIEPSNLITITSLSLYDIFCGLPLQFSNDLVIVMLLFLSLWLLV